MSYTLKASLLTLAMLCMPGSAGAAPQSDYDAGEQLFRQENFVAAERAWTKAAAAGDVRAQYMLGLALASGRYLPIDRQRGQAYLAAASDKGYGDATHALYGYRRSNHLGPLSEAIALLEKAAAQGSTSAKVELGIMSGTKGLGMQDGVLDMLIPTRVSKLEAAGRTDALVRGRKVYDDSCQVCHAAGVMNAPQLADRPEWSVRNKKGFNVLVRHAVDGYKSHPAKGGMPALSGDEIRDAVFYMSAGPST
ncbi:c-type cytochrome [Massilia antarctica]|uniref:C-type cytochrome n=1 Tax=Massilia antarctica TaxID=2765360 RepID=A0AA49A628_9BURK|nr:c-type cytochrome [Massilia antarctica]QPI47839.1 c-type cytochrome [Massilia antarctica]